MGKSITMFKNAHRSIMGGITLNATGAGTISEFSFYNNIMAVRFKGNPHQVTLGNFPYRARMINAAVVTTWGKAAHALDIHNGTSNSANLVAYRIPTVAANRQVAPVSVFANKTIIEKGGQIKLCVSGTSVSVRGTLIVQFTPA